MFVKGDRIRVIAGTYAGMMATVAKDTVEFSWPLVHAVVDGAMCDAGYSFHVREIEHDTASHAFDVRRNREA